MELLHLRYFKKVAQLQHVSKAAAELFVAQSAVSKIIHNLEKELGQELFTRNGKHIRLNQNGAVLLKYVNRILGEVENIQNHFHDIGGEDNTVISILLSSGSRLFPQAISQFRSLYPNIQFVVTQDEAKANDCDLSIYSTHDQPLTNNTYTILRENILLAVPYAYEIAQWGQISLSHITEQNFIGLQKHANLRKITDTLCKRAGFSPRYIWECDNPSMLREMIQLGFGIAFIPEVTWGDTASFKSKLLRFSDGDCHRYFNISWKQCGYTPKAVSLFKNYIIDYYSQLGNQLSPSELLYAPQ